MASGGTSTAAAAAAAAPWRSLLAAALHSNSHLNHSTFFQLATVSANGRPANRTVVFRGFQDGCDKIQINTDSRTSKIEEIRHCPYGEICWYFSESWEQFRISGRIDVVDSSTRDLAKQQQREKCWFASSLRSRLLYLGPSPRLPALHEEPGTNHELDPLKGPVDTFSILVFDPEQVDYLNLKRNERLLFKSSHSSTKESVVWQLEKINP